MQKVEDGLGRQCRVGQWQRSWGSRKDKRGGWRAQAGGWERGGGRKGPAGRGREGGTWQARCGRQGEASLQGHVVWVRVVMRMLAQGVDDKGMESQEVGEGEGIGWGSVPGLGWYVTGLHIVSDLSYSTRYADR